MILYDRYRRKPVSLIITMFVEAYYLKYKIY